MVAKGNMSPKKILLISLLGILLLFSIYLLKIYQSSVKSRICSDSEVGISLILPKGWTCHLSEQNGFYIESPWVESKANTGPAPKFTIWFKKKPDYSGLKIDPRFCNMNEYSTGSTECPEFVYYTNNDFQIKKLVNQKRPEYGVSKTYIGVYKDFLEIEFIPTSTDFELNNEDRSIFDKIFDSIKRI